MERGRLRYQIRQCDREACRFRFPAVAQNAPSARCPLCGGPTAVVQMPLAKRQTAVATAVKSRHLEVLLDNIRSLYNVGSIFRTADGAGVRHLHLCGMTATPAHPKLAKTALGADSQMSWSYGRNGVDTAVGLKEQGYQIWSLEDTDGADSLFGAEITLTPPVVLIVGNENVGIDPAILEISDRVYSLPMQGVKDSLNVAVAFGIALYTIQFGTA